MTLRRSAVVILLSLCAFTAFGDVSKKYVDLITGPAHYLLTKDEAAAWKRVKTDQEAERFIDQFFARRDPSPGTPANEFREGFEQRVAVANENFAAASPGSMTDRGRVFVLLGSPTRVRRSEQGPGSRTIQTGPRGMVPAPDTIQSYSPKEIWIYEQAKTPFELGQAVAEVAFIDQYGSNDFKLERTPTTNYPKLFEAVANSFVTPEGQAAVLAAAAAPSPAQASPAGAGAVRSEALLAALERAKTASANPASAHLTYGEFITSDAQQFVPVQLYFTKAAGLAAGEGYTFFGTVTNEAGESVAAFEEPARLTASQDGLYVARSLAIPAGTYRGTFGLARGNEPLSVVTAPMTIRGIESGASEASMLIVSNDVSPMTQAQEPTEPFAFGGLRVVPKSDGVFRTSEELWYFFEVRNPGIDPETQQPKLMLRLSVTGKAADGRNVRMNAPADLIAAQELKGVPGHWAVGQSIPLATFRPGSYTLTANVTDQTLGKSWKLEQSFTIVE